MYIGEKIYLYEIDTMKELSLTFFRLAAFFEQEPFIGIKFGDDEWIEAQLDADGNFIKYSDGTNYFDYWDGYNMPVKTVLAFDEAFAGQLTKREQMVVDQAKSMPEDGYIIGWAKLDGFLTTRAHEIAHALYYTVPEYKTQAHAIVESLTPTLRTQFIEGLDAMGYTVTDHEYVNDEIQAYLVGYNAKEYKKYYFPTINKKEVKMYVGQMKTLYDKTLLTLVDTI